MVPNFDEFPGNVLFWFNKTIISFLGNAVFNQSIPAVLSYIVLSHHFYG